MDEELIKIGFRIECLKLAVTGREGYNSEELVRIAGEYSDYAFHSDKVVSCPDPYLHHMMLDDGK